MLNIRLKELRKRDSITQDELAKQLNISPSTVSMYESGYREPDIATLIKIAQTFNVTTDYLLGLSDCLYFEIKEPYNKSDSQRYINELSKSLSKLIQIVENIK